MKALTPFFTIATLALCVSQTALAKEPVIDAGDPSRMTVDGLYPIKHSRIDTVFARPDFDLSPYDQVMVAPVSIAYQKKSFELSEEQVNRMGKYFSESLTKQLGEGGYQLATEPGPNVLLLDASIVDLKINRPTKPTVGRTTIFTAESGEMTLIGELRDSMSGEILVRFADRQRPRSHWSRSTSVSEWAEVRRAFNFWASILNERLSAFHNASN